MKLVLDLLFILALSIVVTALSRSCCKAEAFGTTPIPMASPSVVPLNKNRLKFVCQNCTYAESQKIAAGELILNDIMHGDCFDKFMLARSLVQTGNRSNAKVVAHLRSFNATVPVQMYYKADGLAVAYRNIGSTTIHLNRRVFKPKTNSCDFSSVMGHESSHAIGEYSHDFNLTARRPYSVPYSINRGIEACCVR